MNLILEIIIGAVAAAGMIYFTRRIYPFAEFKAYRNYLIIAALAYVFFLFFGSDFRWRMIEIGGVIVYSAIALFSYQKNLPKLLAFGWLLHVAWDLLLHNPIDTPFVPEAYPGLCLGFDVIMAIYIFQKVEKRKSNELSS